MTMTSKKKRTEYGTQSPFEVLQHMADGWNKSKRKHIAHRHPYHGKKVKKVMMSESRKRE